MKWKASMEHEINKGIVKHGTMCFCDYLISRMKWKASRDHEINKGTAKHRTMCFVTIESAESNGKQAGL
jgi:hypothetical protein